MVVLEAGDYDFLMQLHCSWSKATKENELLFKHLSAVTQTRRDKIKIELFCSDVFLPVHSWITLKKESGQQDDEGTSLFPSVTPWMSLGNLGKNFSFQDFLWVGDHILAVPFFFCSFRVLCSWVFCCFLSDNSKPTFIHRCGVLIIPKYFWALGSSDL